MYIVYIRKWNYIGPISNNLICTEKRQRWKKRNFMQTNFPIWVCVRVILSLYGLYMV